MTRRPDHVQSKLSRLFVGETLTAYAMSASEMSASEMSAATVGILGALIDLPP